MFKCALALLTVLAVVAIGGLIQLPLKPLRAIRGLIRDKVRWLTRRPPSRVLRASPRMRMAAPLTRAWQPCEALLYVRQPCPVPACGAARARTLLIRNAPMRRLLAFAAAMVVCACPALAQAGQPSRDCNMDPETTGALPADPRSLYMSGEHPVRQIRIRQRRAGRTKPRRIPSSAGAICWVAGWTDAPPSAGILAPRRLVSVHRRGRAPNGSRMRARRLPCFPDTWRPARPELPAPTRDSRTISLVTGA